MAAAAIGCSSRTVGAKSCSGAGASCETRLGPFDDAAGAIGAIGATKLGATAAWSLGTSVTRRRTGTGPNRTNKIPAMLSVAATQASRKSCPSTKDRNCKFQSVLSAAKHARSRAELDSDLGVLSPLTGRSSANLRRGAARGYGRDMRRSLDVVLAIAAIAATATVSHAQEEPASTAPESEPSSEGRPVEKGTLGIGIILGEPTGIAAKLYLQDDQAIQGAIGASFFAYGYSVHADYVLHPWILQDRDTFVLPVYVGPGLRVIDYAARGQDSHWAVGLRAVGGLLFDFKNVPLDVFVEAAAILEYDFTEGVGLALNVGAGVRYYF